MLHTTGKVSEATNRNLPAKNTLVQLLALYAQRYRQTDRQTGGRRDDSNSRSYTVRSAKTARTTTRENECYINCKNRIFGY